MLEYWYLTPIAAVASTVAISSGVGGPIFFTPLFILVLQLPPATAVAAALFTQTFGFLSGSVAYWRRGLIDARLARGLSVLAIPAALLGSLLAPEVPVRWLRAGFGVVAVLVGWRVFVFRVPSHTGPAQAVPSDDAFSHTMLVSRDGTTYSYRPRRSVEGMAVTTVAATLLGLISVGLAELQAYHFIVRRRIPTPVAVATNVGVVVMAVVTASLGHLYNLTLRAEDDALGTVGRVVLFTIPGVLVGGQIGPLVQERVSPPVIRRGIAILLTAVGCVMLVT